MEVGKQSKHRMTVVACTNATGIDKMSLLFIGKHAHPCCLKKINMQHWVVNILQIKRLDDWRTISGVVKLVCKAYWYR